MDSVLLKLDFGEKEVVVDIDVIAEGSWVNKHIAEVTKVKHWLVMAFHSGLVGSEEHFLDHLTTLEWMSILTVNGALCALEPECSLKQKSVKIRSIQSKIATYLQEFFL